MLQGCSKRRPDVYFNLPMTGLIVEIDENQHRNYEDLCECARINEIVNGIGGRSVVIIRYNPDTVRNKGKIITVSAESRINLLVKIVNDEINTVHMRFIVKIIQLWYNDDYDEYMPVKSEDITDKVSV
jgi:hypothetical protein